VLEHRSGLVFTRRALACVACPSRIDDSSYNPSSVCRQTAAMGFSWGARLSRFPRKFFVALIEEVAPTHMGHTSDAEFA
jgi:hypothetical protein